MSADTLYIFGDQSLPLSPSIQRMCRLSYNNVFLKEFLRIVVNSIQSALWNLPAHIRPDVLPLNSLIQLAESIDTEPTFTPLVCSLSTVAQLGDFILHLSSKPDALEDSHIASVFVGLCTGSLAAAAVASSRNLLELLDISPHIVSLSFNIGMEALARARSLDHSSGSWAVVIKDIDCKDTLAALEDFNSAVDDGCHKRVYISAVTESSVTVSGPPTKLQKLFDSNLNLSRRRRLQLPIHSAFHARHLVPIPYSRITKNLCVDVFDKPVRCSVLSPCTGKFYSSRSLNNTLEEITDEILQQPINWPNITRELSNLLLPSATAISMGPFIATKAVSRWMHRTNQQKSSEGLCIPNLPHSDVAGGIAIVGMAIRAPGAENLEDFWEILKAGTELHKNIPVDRFDVKDCKEQSRKRPRGGIPPYGVFLDRPGYFDPKFFNMSPREALQTDPQQRLMLLTTYEALENAGYSPNRTPSYNTARIASFIGQTGDDYRECNANQDVDSHFITGNIRAFGPGRLNYYFGWEGQSYSVDTACSSSGASIQLACSTLISKECDAAVCGGANLLTSPDLFDGLARGGFLSQTGQCKTFDKDADGYVRGEACGVLILKRLEDALQENDNVLAVIRGAKTNHSANAISITHPHQETQERLFRSVLDSAGVQPHEIGLAEVHGTGTQAGDSVESRSITNVLCKGRSADNPLVLSSVKPNVGHSEAASGVTSVVKAVLMLQKNMIPPHVGIKGCINDKLPSFEPLNVRLCATETPFRQRPGSSSSKRRILVNNFDAAGGNTSMLLEDPPQMQAIGQDPRSHKVVTFSAKCVASLTSNIRNTVLLLKSNSDIRIDDLAYTTTARRMHHTYRRAYSAQSMEQLITSLEREKPREIMHQKPRRPNTVFCFTGQGSHYLSMAAGLYNTHTTFRDLIDDYQMICESLGFPSFMPVISGDAKLATCPVRIQLSLVAIELALALLWKSWGVQAGAVIGHSLGEYAALCYAKVISVHDCFRLVGRRAQLITERCVLDSFAMLAVQAPPIDIKRYLTHLPVDGIEFACFNSSLSTVVSGPRLEIELLQKSLKLDGVVAKPLPTRHAFHSSRMDAILDDLEVVARKVNFSKPDLPVASTLLGVVVTDKDIFSAQYMKLQTRSFVQFEDAIRALGNASIANEDTVWIEIGPSSTCTSMVKATVAKARAILPSLQRAQQNWQTLSSSLVGAYAAGLDIDWTEFHRPFESHLQMIQLPNYCFDLENYWIKGRHAVLSGTHQRGEESLSSIASQCEFKPTTCLHRIDQQDNDGDAFSITFAADVSLPSFNKLLQGHCVNGVALCSSSVYAEMALTASRHIQKVLNLNPGCKLEVNDMIIKRPLIISSHRTKQVILVRAKKHRSSSEIEIQCSSQEGSIRQTHAKCKVLLASDASPVQQPMDDTSSIKARIGHLHRASAHGKAHRILRPMVYKLFKHLVDYDKEYQGLEEVFLDTSMLEATANITLCDAKGDFTCNPYWIDSIAHLSGFILNGSEFTPDDAVFISHGWRSLKLLQSLSPKKAYQSYTCMKPTKCQTAMSGDVYVFDDDQLVAVCQDLHFRQVRRRLLHQMLNCAPSNLIAGGNQGEEISLLSDTSAEVPTRKSESVSTTDGIDLSPDFELVLDVIAGELGLDSSELNIEAELQHLGIDSLMMANILATLGGRLRLKVPISTLVECRTLNELRSHLCAGYNRPCKPPWPEFEPPEARTSVSTSGDRATQPSDSSSCILAVIAEELGVATSELDDSALLADLGVDSLLAISMLSSLGELVGRRLPASLLAQCPSVRELCLFFQSTFYRQDLEEMAPDPTSNATVSAEPVVHTTTPVKADGHCCREGGRQEVHVMTELVCEVAAEEAGSSRIDVGHASALLKATQQSIVDVPTLMEQDKQRETESGLHCLTSDAVPFVAKRNVLQDAQFRCVGVVGPIQRDSTIMPPPNRSTASLARLAADTKTWSASSILLQGSPSRTKPCLFLIPDGSGNPLAYTRLPHLGYDGDVYGLNSPFLASPGEFRISLEELVALYIQEMRRIQPQGPYHLGGWSFGGVCAFEAASQLIRRQGEEVSSITFVDAPCPTVLPPLPLNDVDFLDIIGAFETLKPSSRTRTTSSVAVVTPSLSLPSNIREHFAGSINALQQYQATAIEGFSTPRSVTALWARYGVWETLGEEAKAYRSDDSGQERHPTTGWLMDARPDHGTGGWEKLLPKSSFTCHIIEGDHFSMMSEPGVSEMGAKISSSLARAA